jgi:hypothetical protein
MQETNEPQSSHQVSVEDLLRLKRHEKPDAAYWERFDRELHQKSWQALAKPRPAISIWSGLRAFGGKFVPALPLSAAAAFVVVLSLNYFPSYTPTSPAAPVYAAAAPVYAEAATPVAGMAEDFAGGAHQATFVVGQFDGGSAAPVGGNVTLVAASRPMPVETNHNVHYVGGSFDSGFGSENASVLNRIY